MNKTWLEMGDTEREAAIAERLGYKWWKEDKGDYTLYYLWDFDPAGRFRGYKGEAVRPEEAWANQGAWYTKSFPRYTSELAAAFKLEEAVKARGLVPQYVHYLVRVLHTRLVKLDVQDDRADIFAIAHASPAQRAEAAYLALTKG